MRKMTEKKGEEKKESEEREKERIDGKVKPKAEDFVILLQHAS